MKDQEAVTKEVAKAERKVATAKAEVAEAQAAHG